MREQLSIDRVMALAEAGENFTLEAGDVPVGDLLLLAAVIGGSSASVRFRNVHERSLEDLMRITVAGRGRVHLETKPAVQAVPPPRNRWFRRRGACAGAVNRAA